MPQQVSNPPERTEAQPPHGQPPNRHTRFSMLSIVLLLILVSFLILSSSVLLVISAVQEVTQPLGQAATSTPTQLGTQSKQTLTPAATTAPSITPTVIPPISAPGNTVLQPLQLPSDRSVIYEQQNSIYLVSSTGATPQAITTPGYVYNQAVHPLLTPTGQLLYSGDGIWLTDIFGGTAVQIAKLPANQIITSLAVSSDGTTIAWSTEPTNGNGSIAIFAGSLASPTKVFEQPSTNCPCFRIFAFMNGNGKQGDSTLLLTDGQQSHEAIQFGLWTFDLNKPLTATPQEILGGDTQQGPLALLPFGNTLLYSSYEGEVPIPTDGSVPSDLAVVKYPNSLDLTTLGGQPLAMDGLQVVLAEQHQLANSAAYHWITTPVFTPDGHTLIYVEFSSQAQPPFDRTSAIFEVHISGSGKTLRASKPQLLVTSTAALLELGPWFNAHILTFFADNSLYALDVRSGAATTIVQTSAYARMIAVVGTGGV
ncbi:MAG TPA: hypothetical protein VGN15_01105 [Ktedonobacteraceae bacterium]|nr:hypothetical protein [Ktedonobacteraceae bacterium]